jgi:hypothetical protein
LPVSFCQHYYTIFHSSCLLFFCIPNSLSIPHTSFPSASISFQWPNWKVPATEVDDKLVQTLEKTNLRPNMKSTELNAA